MEKIAKNLQLVLMVIILISTVIAVGIEISKMFQNRSVTLADLLLMFLYLEVLAMVRVFWESQSIQITLPLFIAITALARFIILQGKSLNPEELSNVIDFNFIPVDGFAGKSDIHFSNVV